MPPKKKGKKSKANSSTDGSGGGHRPVTRNQAANFCVPPYELQVIPPAREEDDEEVAPPPPPPLPPRTQNDLQEQFQNLSGILANYNQPVSQPVAEPRPVAQPVNRPVTQAQAEPLIQPVTISQLPKASPSDGRVRLPYAELLGSKLVGAARDWLLSRPPNDSRYDPELLRRGLRERFTLTARQKGKNRRAIAATTQKWDEDAASFLEQRARRWQENDGIIDATFLNDAMHGLIDPILDYVEERNPTTFADLVRLASEKQHRIRDKLDHQMQIAVDEVKSLVAEVKSTQSQMQSQIQNQIQSQIQSLQTQIQTQTVPVHYIADNRYLPDNYPSKRERSHNNDQRHNKRQGLECYRCGKPGHVSKHCRTPYFAINNQKRDSQSNYSNRPRPNNYVNVPYRSNQPRTQSVNNINYYNNTIIICNSITCNR
jgi:hypothetical protein